VPLFQGHQNQAPVVVSYTANDATKRQVVEFNSCLFQDNVQGSSDFGGEQLGTCRVVHALAVLLRRNLPHSVGRSLAHSKYVSLSLNYRSNHSHLLGQ
jgi:hypothetical protein